MISSVPLAAAILLLVAFGAALHGVRVLVPKAAESSLHPEGAVFRPGMPRQLLLASAYSLSFAASVYVAWIPQVFVARDSVLQTYWSAFLVCETISIVIGGLVLRRAYRQDSGPRLSLSSAFVGSFVLHVEMAVITFFAAIAFTLRIGG